MGAWVRRFGIRSRTQPDAVSQSLAHIDPTSCERHDPLVHHRSGGREMMRWCPVAALSVLLFLSSVVMGQGRPPETLKVSSLTMGDDSFLQGKTEDGSPVVLTGRLSLPDAEGRLPVVILLHGSAGPGGAQMPTWAKLLNENGIAAFALDSYTGRGLEEVFSDQGRLGILSPIYDLYRAVEILADHPAIDPDRIAVIGFSRGGVGALYSALIRFQKMYGPRRGRLLAHLPFYPPCNFELERDTEVGPAPIRHFHGIADDWNPIEVCRAYIGRLKASGADVEIFEYEGAQHAFDNPGAPAYFVNGQAQTSRNCLRKEVDGRLTNAATGEPFSWTQACVETGPATQYNGPAAEAATAAALATLKSAFETP
ncbi:dienelactone hydrolase family protein [Fulvimarina sp. 2208YS6-2-32]|uniref:Dienelactone hydrolase family protein n=1 Tax=Fulvimarina uroteuthidis TaxID=3098149 RepID=A0ABU5I7C8_9HYPH|nr:dienelactone hydrolase family protein [Fulvimarina sp. 2208YS6-2-32]MDY8111146.1 dienelactone hydrolase family protein [Fulvimarina sp. 2208YS6-2-32]